MSFITRGSDSVDVYTFVFESADVHPSRKIFNLCLCELIRENTTLPHRFLAPLLPGWKSMAPHHISSIVSMYKYLYIVVWNRIEAVIRK